MPELWGLISWLAIGAIAGVVARWMPPGGQARLVPSLALGVAGALFGGVLASWLGFGGISGFDVRSLVVALLGAILLVLTPRILRPTPPDAES